MAFKSIILATILFIVYAVNAEPLGYADVRTIYIKEDYDLNLNGKNSKQCVLKFTEGTAVVPLFSRVGLGEMTKTNTEVKTLKLECHKDRICRRKSMEVDSFCHDDTVKPTGETNSFIPNIKIPLLEENPETTYSLSPDAQTQIYSIYGIKQLGFFLARNPSLESCKLNFRYVPRYEQGAQWAPFCEGTCGENDEQFVIGLQDYKPFKLFTNKQEATDFKKKNTKLTQIVSVCNGDNLELSRGEDKLYGSLKYNTNVHFEMMKVKLIEANGTWKVKFDKRRTPTYEVNGSFINAFSTDAYIAALIARRENSIADKVSRPERCTLNFDVNSNKWVCSEPLKVLKRIKSNFRRLVSKSSYFPGKDVYKLPHGEMFVSPINARAIDVRKIGKELYKIDIAAGRHLYLPNGKDCVMSYSISEGFHCDTKVTTCEGTSIIINNKNELRQDSGTSLQDKSPVKLCSVRDVAMKWNRAAQRVTFTGLTYKPMNTKKINFPKADQPVMILDQSILKNKSGRYDVSSTFGARKHQHILRMYGIEVIAAYDVIDFVLISAHYDTSGCVQNENCFFRAEWSRDTSAKGVIIQQFKAHEVDKFIAAVNKRSEYVLAVDEFDGTVMKVNTPVFKNPSSTRPKSIFIFTEGFSMSLEIYKFGSREAVGVPNTTGTANILKFFFALLTK